MEFGELMLLLLILGILIFLWDIFDRHRSRAQQETGLDKNFQAISVRGSSQLPGISLNSDTLGLYGSPDAIIRENEFNIPVINKPLSKKIRDRHVIELLVYMRLITEKEGKSPPYGIIVLGAEHRQVKIRNTEQKQKWLDSLLDEMRSIIDGVPAVPSPAVYKCRSCDVRKFCAYSAYHEKPGKAAVPAEGEADSEDET